MIRDANNVHRRTEFEIFEQIDFAAGPDPGKIRVSLPAHSAVNRGGPTGVTYGGPPSCEMRGRELIEAFVLGVIGNVLSNYISGLLTNRQTERNRGELVALIESKVKENRALESRQAMGVAVRELDAVVGKDRDLTWRDDRLVIRPSGRIRKTLPDPQAALEELVNSVAARRRELGLPLTAEVPVPGPTAAPAAGSGAAVAGSGNAPAEGDLLPPDESAPAHSAPDLRAEILGLPAEVLREKERRRRESGRD
ncbi:hypothetical protein [Actinomadura opuntiae]|uniref:hypothetical protein n=1 Tax=Actinomadura sp. OS1-43 TaxID=604315 RepID=UPI00255A9024|nr:hypothetical protein [Actinomadura sp. OS1-43]MDL4818917.1 hypothetical protein [Actinomadura sp. OS1-43]